MKMGDIKIIRTGWGAEVPVIEGVPLSTLRAIMDKVRNYTWVTEKGNEHIDIHPIIFGYSPQGGIDYIVIMTHTRTIYIDLRFTRIIEWKGNKELIIELRPLEMGTILTYMIKNMIPEAKWVEV